MLAQVTSPSVAVVGVGAIGGVCAANLVDAGHDVVCCVRTRFDELVLESGDQVRRFAPRVELDPAGVAPVRWVLIATKAHQTEAAAGWFARLVGAGTQVAVLQNGVEHVERLARWIDPARVVPVVIACPSTAVAPGHVVQRRAARLTVPDDVGGRGFAALFGGTAVAVEPTDDWPTAAWRKLCLNVTGGALAALAGAPLSEVRHPRLRDLALALAHECAWVARAEGADVPARFADEVAEQTIAAPLGGTPSTLTDRLRGRPLEVDARNGTVVRLGARHRIAVPANARAAELMAGAHLEPAVDLLSRLAEIVP
jgi:2-dehydropantoate 2-reductase